MLRALSVDIAKAFRDHQPGPFIQGERIAVGTDNQHPKYLIKYENKGERNWVIEVDQIPEPVSY
jgi:hypothetical protein